MTDVVVSLWLPVGRANFYSVTANGWLLKDESVARGMTCQSKKLDEQDYIPKLQCSVLRRLLEVLPASFGYEREGVYEAADETEPDERTRPVTVTLTLSDLSRGLDDTTSTRWRANHELHEAGVRTVRLRVDEHGNYTFTAAPPAGGIRDAVRTALISHAREVFGGDFAIRRLEKPPRRFREGAAAVRRYNGLTQVTKSSLVEEVESPPLGALTFFQLNTLVEGLCNETLSPAVFFERYEFVREYLTQPEPVTRMFENVGQIIETIAGDDDASTLDGQIATLRHFLAVTSRESLQRIKWSVESVRRSLLDEMMSVLHRQSRLVQMDLGAIKRERSPELAVDASESQLRGYVMLASAKLPLITNVYEVANLTVDGILARAKRERTVAVAPATAHSGYSVPRQATGPSDRADPAGALESRTEELEVHLKHWKLLLDSLANNVRSLEHAVEQAWMERLLYEEQQSRSEQEAIAEIERSRYGRPARAGGGRSAHDAINLILTALAIFFVAATTDFKVFGSELEWWRQVAKLWPIAAVAVIFYLVLPAVGFLYRWHRDRRGVSDAYGYEFAFLLDEPTEPKLGREFLNKGKRRHVRVIAADLDEPRDLAGPSSRPARRKLERLKGVSLTPHGGGRIERISADSSSLKLHLILTFRVAWFRYARFEIVNEILASRVSDQPRFLLHQVRVFGDSPRPLDPATVVELVDLIRSEVARPLTTDNEVDDPLSLLRGFYD